MYFAVPTAPPWLAAEEGYLDGVLRIPKVLSHELTPGAYESGETIAGSNAVAAMPSLHMAVTVVIAMAASRRGPFFALSGIIYVFSMAFALLYLGEHYAIDLVAGVILAAVVFTAVEKCFARRSFS